jgi:hypothetical protein
MVGTRDRLAVNGRHCITISHEVIGAIASGLIRVGRIVAATVHLHADAALLKA